MNGWAIPREKFNFGQIFDFSFSKETRGQLLKKRSLTLNKV
jgi:hypothetical protein